jgi:hypothetical protein
MFVHPTRGDLAAELSPEQQLIRAVFSLAYRDLHSKSGHHRSEAEAFFRGHLNSLRVWCDLAGLDIAVVQRKAFRVAYSKSGMTLR